MNIELNQSPVIIITLENIKDVITLHNILNQAANSHLSDYEQSLKAKLVNILRGDA